MAVSVNNSEAVTSASFSATVPSGVKAAVFMWSYWNNADTGYGLASATLGGVSPDHTFELPGNTGPSATGYALWLDPPTGSQTLAYSLDSTATEGPSRRLVYLDASGTVTVRDEDAGAAESTTAVSVTLTGLTVGDLVLAMDAKTSGTAPANQTDYTDLGTQVVNSIGARTRYIVATGTSQAADCQGEDYSSIVAVALYEVVSTTVDQQDFRFGDDDGSESTYTQGTQGANKTVALGTPFIYRALLQAVGDPASFAPTLYAQKNGSGGYSAVAVGSSVKVTPVIESGDATTSGNNTAQASWAVSVPNASTGDLLIIGIAWDDSTTTTDATEPAGQNGETLLEVNATPATDASTETRAKVWYVKCTGAWTAGTITFTPSATESWSAICVRVPAGEFDATTPIGAAATSAATGGAETNVNTAAFSAGGTDGSGKLCVFASADADPQSVASGFSSVGTQDLGAVTHGFFTRDTAVSNSESISATAAATIASDSWAAVSFVVRAPTITPEIYVATSANITAGGEATTDRMTGGTGSFVTGRIWDNENGSDSVDITTDNYTQVAHVLNTQSPAAAADYWDLRYYNGASPLDSYTATGRVTIAGGQTVAIGLISETDSALGFTWKKVKAVGLNTETDSALAATAKKAKAIGLNTETDSALAATWSKAKAIGLTTETDEAFAFTRSGQAVAIGLATETDSALAVGKAKALTIGQATETDSAFAFTWSKLKAIGLALETNTALAFRVVKALLTGKATETDSAFSFTWRKTKAIGQAQETDSALGMTSTGGGGGIIKRLKNLLLGVR